MKTLILTRKLNTSFRPERSREPESRNLLIKLDSRVRENDEKEHRISSI